MTPEATGPESLRQKIARTVEHFVDQAGYIEKTTDAILALLPPTVQEDAGWLDELAEGYNDEFQKAFTAAIGRRAVLLTNSTAEAHARLKEIKAAERLIVALPRLLAIARSGSGGTGGPELRKALANVCRAFDLYYEDGVGDFTHLETMVHFAKLELAKVGLKPLPAPPPAGAGK